MAGIARYPKDFTAGDSIGTDYIIFTAVRKSYNQSNNPDSSSNNVLYNEDASFTEDTSIKDTTKVILYMPQKIMESYSQGWTNNTLGPEVGRILQGINSIGSQLVGAPGGMPGAIGRRLLEEFVMNQALQGAAKLGASSLTANAVLSASGGVIYNPMMEVLYDGPDFRRFNYEFTLFSKSEDDAKEIYKIVNFFRFCSVPTYESSGVGSTLGNSLQATSATNSIGGITSSTSLNNLAKNVVTGAGAATLSQTAGSAGFYGGENRFIKQPPFIKVQYRRNATNHPYILNPKPCAITSLSIDFTPTGNYTVLDNFGKKQMATVVATTISFSLTEIKAMYSEDIDGQLTKM
jgi:hypothetical protein